MKSKGTSLVRVGGLRKAAALAVGLPLLLSSVAVGPATAAPTETGGVEQAKNVNPTDYKDGRYIVVLAEKAAAAYDGGTAGIAATKPQQGRKLDSGSQNYKAYDAHLRKAQRDVAARQGVAPSKQFTGALNGFVAELTAVQAAELAKDSNVLVVAPDVENAPDYTTTDFLKLTGSDGAWAKQFGGESGAGKGVVVGVIDSGYAPDNPFLRGIQCSRSRARHRWAFRISPRTARSPCSSRTARPSRANARRASNQGPPSTEPSATPRWSAPATSPTPSVSTWHPNTAPRRN